VLNSRIRKSWIHTGLEVGLIGERVDTTYGYDYLGQDVKALADFIAGKGEFAKKFAAAQRPLIIVGSAIGEHADGPAVYNAFAKFVEKNQSKLVMPGWNGFAVLQRVCLLAFVISHYLPAFPGCLSCCRVRYRLCSFEEGRWDETQVHLSPQCR
jgi:hypothetical protein